MDKNQTIGFTLIGLLLIGFWWINKPTQEQIEEQNRYYDSIQNARKAAIEAEAKVAELNAAPLFNEEMSDSIKEEKANQYFGEFARGARGDEQIIRLENELLRMDISTHGGIVKAVELKEYTNYKKEPLYLFQEEENQFNLQLQTVSNRTIQTKELCFQVKSQNDSSVVLSVPTAEGSLDLCYKLPANSYMVGFDILTKNLGSVLKNSDTIKANWNLRISQLEKGRTFENRYSQIYYYSNEDGKDELSETSDDEESVAEPLRWIAFKNQYFSSVLIADESIQKTNLKSTIATDSSKYLKKYQASMSLPCKDEAVHLRYYFGPNKYSLLKSFDKDLSGDDKLNLKRIVPLGAAVFRWVNQILSIPLFNFFGSFLTNYGLIIFLMTVVVKLIIFPLTYKSYLSQAKMKALKPMMDEINERIPEEKATERSQAMMELYSKAGVNPMGGCLPMLLQMPILIALFYFFPTAIELRGQSFLWAQDLSTYDDVISWSFNIPFIGNHISLFCLLMTIANIAYTKYNMDMSSSSGQMNQMPIMKYMMYFMPLMFLFIFNDYASGLSYYYFVSLLITIIQTYVIRKFFVDDEKLAKQIKENQKKPMKKSTWLSRIEEINKAMQEEQKRQQEAAAQRKN